MNDPILNWASHRPDGFASQVWKVGQQGDFLRKQLKDYPLQSDAFEFYVGGESLWMNRVLRNDPTCAVIDTESMRRWQSRNNQLAALIDAAPTTEGNLSQVVFRGANAGPPQYGSVWTKPDFTSTTFDWGEALAFNTDNMKLNRCCMMVIQIPPGVSVLEIAEESLFDSEGEVLINRGSRFRAEKTVDVAGHTIHYLTLMGGTEPPRKRRRSDDQLSFNFVNRRLSNNT
mgnify:CR=1 FL=1|tara:strand:+ start:733 stop:1419 length:687 start_codon:yes stop_codon:yes gene_type:complete